MSSRFRVILLPGGVLPADLAYGALRSDWRLHFSVGYGF